MRRIAPLSAFLFLLGVLCAPAQAATSLPTVQRALSATGTLTPGCATTTATARRGTDVATYRAPISGFASIRLNAARGDWDLNVVDAASGRSLGASQGFRGREVVQAWLAAGQRVAIVGCRERGASRTAGVAVDLLDVAPPKLEGKTSLVRVFGGESQIGALERAGFDVTHNHTSEWADVLVSGDGQRKMLTKLGLRTETRIADYDQHVRGVGARDAAAVRRAGGSSLPTGRESYRQYEDYQFELKELVRKHPGHVKPVVIGSSYQGRELNGVEIADDVKGTDGRPVFFFMALHHAREWPSAETAMEFATLLAEQGKTDPRLKRILESTRTVVVPLINPDGYVSSRKLAPIDPADNLRDNSPTGDPGLYTWEVVGTPGGIFSYRRKNCAGEVPNPNFPCELQWGVDPNRNYGQFWGGPGSSPDPGSQSYHGPGPWSEPETQAVHAYSQQRQVTSLVTLHNVAALVLRPPGEHTQGKAPDEQALKRLGDAMAEAAGYKSQYGFELYDTTGTTEDWNYAAAGTFGYTIEMGPANGQFHMPYKTGVTDQWDGTYAKNGKGLREALLLAAEASFDTSNHGVLKGKAPAGRTLRVKKTFDTRTSEHCVIGAGYGPFNPAFFASFGLPEEYCPGGRKPAFDVADKLESTTKVPADGRFAWHVTPSTRPFVGVERTEVSEAGEPTTEERTPQKQTKPWLESDPVGAAPVEQGPTPDSAIEDQPLTIAPNVARAVVSLTFPNPQEDYDLKVFRRESDGKLTEVGTSGNFNGQDEQVELVRPEAGDYVIRVVNYYGPSNKWTAKIERFAAVTKTSPAQREAWTLTCEDRGRVVERREVIVGRGDQIDLGAFCGAREEKANNGNGNGSQGGSGQPGAEPGKAKSGRRALSARQRRALNRCLARNKRAAKRQRWSAARKRKATKACWAKARRVRRA
jgi:hypothetical protein